MSASEKPAKFDPVPRGIKGSSPTGTILFLFLRFLDIPLQHYILANGLGSSLFHRLGIQAATRTPILDSNNFLSLSPYRLLVLSMASGTVLKQFFWLLYLAQEKMLASSALSIGLAGAFTDSIFSLLATSPITSAISSSQNAREALSFSGLSLPVILGTALYLIGSLTELISEIQRKRFKSDPKNKGKLFTGGLFSLARHINLGGYVMLRTAQAMTASGYLAAGIVGAIFFRDFATRAVPVLSEYCQDRYGSSWTEFTKRVPSRLFPGIY